MYSSIAAVAPYFASLLLCTSAAPANSYGLTPRDAACAVAASPPAGTKCGLRGKYTPNKVGPKFLARQFTSLLTCAGFCSDANLNQPSLQCSAFLYNTTSSLCVLLQRHFQAINFTEDASSSTYLYSNACYDCPLQCNAPPDQNLLNNPTFNLSTTRLGPWVAAVEIPRIQPHDDGGSAITYTLDSKSLEDESSSFFQYRYLCPDVEYLLSFDMMLNVTSTVDPSATPTNYSLSFQWGYGDCSYSGVLVPDNTPLGIWRTFGCSLRAQSQSTAAVYFESTITYGSSKIYSYQQSFANMKLTQLSGNPINTTGASLVSNGGFEGKSIDPWVSQSSYEDHYYYYNRFPHYYNNPPDPCVINGKTIPMYGLVKPGLPPTSGAPASKQAFQFCGVTPMIKPSRTYNPENMISFQFGQQIGIHKVEANTLYLLSLTYKEIPQNATMVVLLQGRGPDGNTVQDSLSFNPGQPGADGVVTVQQLFHGSDFGSSVAFIGLHCYYDTFSDYDEQDYFAGPAQLQVIADNFSILQVAE